MVGGKHFVDSFERHRDNLLNVGPLTRSLRILCQRKRLPAEVHARFRAMTSRPRCGNPSRRSAQIPILASYLKFEIINQGLLPNVMVGIPEKSGFASDCFFFPGVDCSDFSGVGREEDGTV